MSDEAKPEWRSGLGAYFTAAPHPSAWYETLPPTRISLRKTTLVAVAQLAGPAPGQMVPGAEPGKGRPAMVVAAGSGSRRIAAILPRLRPRAIGSSIPAGSLWVRVRLPEASNQLRS